MIELFQHDLGIFTVDSLLSASECSDLISRGESIGFEPASVRTHSGQKMMSNIRNNDRVVFNDEILAADLWGRIAEILPVVDGCRPCGVDSNLRFYRYVPGQKFNRHKDGSVTNELGEVSKLSYLIYLNECDGGETVFRDYTEVDGKRQKKEIRIVPSVGSALLFRHERWHEGSPVLSGRKYVIRTDVFYESKSD